MHALPPHAMRGAHAGARDAALPHPPGALRGVQCCVVWLPLDQMRSMSWRADAGCEGWLGLPGHSGECDLDASQTKRTGAM